MGKFHKNEEANAVYVKTERLELKAIGPENLEPLVELLTDETVKQSYMIPDFPDRAAVETLARRLMDLGKERIVAGIYLDGELVGILNETEVLADSVELGYAVLPRFHNRGICTEALTGAIGWCLENGFREVICGAFEGNSASFRVMEKSGMKLLERTDEIEYRGKTYLCRYYGIEKENVSLK